MARRPLLNIVLWKWDQPGLKYANGYTAEHVNVMASMLRRNLAGVPHRIICVTDASGGVTECESFPLWPDAGGIANATKTYLPSCYRRLKLYDPNTQQEMGIERGERIMSIDLDTLIVGPLHDVVHTPGRYVGWGMQGKHRPKVFNGSLQMFTAGDLDFVWKSFDPANSPRVANEAGYLGSDQSWLSMLLAEADDSVSLGWPTIASYSLNVRIQKKVDPDTRIIFYHGHTKPWSPEAYEETGLTNRYWR